MENLRLLVWIILALGSRGEDELNLGKLVKSINTFNLKFYKQLATTENNLFCSGYSLSVALNMLLAGARGNTASEMRSVLDYDSASLTQDEIERSLHALLTEQRRNHTGYELTIANSIWIQEGYNVLEEFKSTLQNELYAEEQQVSFGTKDATQNINDWVNRETKGKIPKLLDDDLDSLTRVVLLNAMYFKGTWETKFNKNLTNDFPFHYSEDGEDKTQDVKMMNIKRRFPYTSSLEMGVQVVELPYEGDEVSMVIVLPFEDKDLNEIEQKITIDDIETLLNTMNSHKEVRLRMPKFEISSTLSLNEILQDLGMEAAFSSERADLSGIDGTKNLYVTDTVQKAVVEVNEEGTVATVSSGVKANVRSGVERPYVVMIVDRPFSYFIRHKPTGITYFIGRYVKP